jgi:hypothetical protein
MYVKYVLSEAHIDSKHYRLRVAGDDVLLMMEKPFILDF